jgi:uncharacterized protein (TIGR03118 family)
VKIKTIGIGRDPVLMISLIGAAGLMAAGVAPVSADPLFAQTNLVSDIPGLAKITDPNLVNAWGISEGPSTPFWISDNGTGVSTLYSVPGSGPPAVTKLGLTVTIPGAVMGTISAPTGQVFNATSGFALGSTGKAFFLFDSEDGAISGWNPSLGTNAAIEVNNSPGAVYKGLAISTANGGTIYATNFRAGTIDAFNSSFAPTLTGDFVDPNLPAGYAPFNDKVINGELYVTYALQDAAKHDDVSGLGHGYVDVFKLDGSFDKRLISQGQLDSPWGLQLAPSSFGTFAGDLLVGNFGNGMINVFNATTGALVGTLDRTDGNPLSIGGLWGLTIGNGAASGGSLNTLYFTAGPNGESDGLFGSLTAVPESSSWAMLLLGFVGLGFMGYRGKRWAAAPAAAAQAMLRSR